MLYLVATPIGNLADITLRALDVLRSCAAVLCEDTRHSQVLLQRHGIERPLLSYHKFNETKELDAILRRLEAGEDLALISDAGTPCLSDPGQRLVAACIERSLPFTAVPGPCSPIMALLLSGLSAERFQFLGFLPKKPAATLRSALCYPGTTLLFESPERLAATLRLLAELAPDRPIAIAREMTKAFEECWRGTAQAAALHFQQRPARGEICLVIGEGEPPWEALSLEELIDSLRDLHGLSLKEAVKLAAAVRREPKRNVYRRVHRDA
jgi:16S rRNA (cytidine1402-2'-O)-methyltransferase